MLKYLFLASAFASLPNIVKEDPVNISVPDLTYTLNTKFKVTDNNFLDLTSARDKVSDINFLNLQITHLYKSIKKLNKEISDLAIKKKKFQDFQNTWNTKKDTIQSSNFKINLDTKTFIYTLEKSKPSAPPEQDPLLINLVEFESKMTVLLSE